MEPVQLQIVASALDSNLGDVFREYWRGRTHLAWIGSSIAVIRAWVIKARVIRTAIFIASLENNTKMA